MKLFQPRVGGGATSAFSLAGASSLTASATGQSQSVKESTNVTSIRKSMRLLVDDVSDQDPQDIAYVYSGVAPLSVRIVQAAVHQDFSRTTRPAAGSANGTATTSGAAPSAPSDTPPSWKGFESILTNVAGPTFSVEQTVNTEAVKAKKILEGRGGTPGGTDHPRKKKTTVVFFLGGVTYVEVAALRFLASKDETGREILITTTGIVGGDRMMDAAMAEAIEHTSH